MRASAHCTPNCLTEHSTPDASRLITRIISTVQALLLTVATTMLKGLDRTEAEALDDAKKQLDLALEGLALRPLRAEP